MQAHHVHARIRFLGIDAQNAGATKARESVDNRSSNFAEPHDRYRGLMQACSVECRLPTGEYAAAHTRVALTNVACQTDGQTYSKFSSGLGQQVRNNGNPDAGLNGSCDIEIVVTLKGAGQHLKSARTREEGGTEPVGHECHDCVAVACVGFNNFRGPRIDPWIDNDFPSLAQPLGNSLVYLRCY